MPTMRIVPTLDEFKHGAARFGRRVERAAIDQLTFKRGEEALAKGIIVTVTDGAHRWTDADVSAAFSEGERCVLAPLALIVGLKTIV